MSRSAVRSTERHDLEFPAASRDTPVRFGGCTIVDETGDGMSATAIGLGAILLWAALAVLTIEAQGIPPFELLALTFAVAFLGGLVVQLVRGRAAVAELRQRVAPWLCAFCGIFFYHALYFFALTAAPPAQASLIAYLWPLLIVLFSALGPGAETLRARHVVGALLGLGGTALLLKHRDAASSSATPALGYVAALGCAFVWSGYSVANRRYRDVPSGMLVGVCGAVAVAGGLCHLGFEPTSVVPDARQWSAIAVIGLGPTGLAFLAWDHATKHGRLALLGALSYLAPVVSVMLLVLAGRANATVGLVSATVLIVGGALLATGILSRRA